MTRIVIMVLILAPVWLWAAEPEDFQRQHAKDGEHYQEALVKAIKASDRIVITEHSDRDDFPLSEQNRKDLPQFEYGRVELDEATKAKFAKNAGAMDATNQKYLSACIFVPHHAIRFYSGSTLKSTMEICFHCGDIQWNALLGTIPPDGLWTAILPLIKDIGFHGDREREVWVARMEAKRKAEREK